MTRKPYPIVSLRWPPEWQERLYDEIQYRLAHGLGNARFPFVVRDAMLASTAAIPQVEHPNKETPGVRQASITIGPTVVAHLEDMAAEGWKASAFCRAALYHYLFSFDVYTRPRNLPGSDNLIDPADPTLDWQLREALGNDPS